MTRSKFLILPLLATSLGLLPACGKKDSKKSDPSTAAGYPLNPSNTADLNLMKAYSQYLPVEYTEDGKTVKWADGKSANLEGTCQNQAAANKVVKLSLYTNSTFNVYLDGMDPSSFRKDEGKYAFDRQTGEIYFSNEFGNQMSCNSDEGGFLNCKTMENSNLSFFQSCDEIHFLNPSPAVPPSQKQGNETAPPKSDGPVIVIVGDDEDDKAPQGFERGTKSEKWDGLCTMDSGQGKHPSKLIFNADGSASLTVDTPTIDESGEFIYYQQLNGGPGLLFYNEDNALRSGKAMGCQYSANSIECNRGDWTQTRILSCEFTK